MDLKLGTLQKVAQRALDEASTHDVLREEIKRVLGPAVITEGNISVVAERANEHIDVLEGTGRQLSSSFKTSVLLKFTENKSREVRKLTARMLPVKFIGKLAGDEDRSVRLAVARRLPFHALKEMRKYFPNDDELRIITRARRVHESGIPQPKVVDEPFDLYGDKRMGDSAKQKQIPDLSTQWYDSMAYKLIQDYDRGIEDQWEETAVHRFCSSNKATNGVEVDEDKLMKSVAKLSKEKDDLTLKKSELKEIAKRLREEAEKELLTESAEDSFETRDPVYELVESNLGSCEYIEQMNRLFKIQESTMPTALRKYRLREGHSVDIMIPAIGKLPHVGTFRSIDERALDRYVRSWTSRQALTGEPVQLSWDPHPGELGKVSFSAMLK